MTPRLPAALLLTALTAASAALVATPAGAAGVRTWYTNPHGGGSDCSQVDPCGIDTAFADAQTGDTISMAGGTYGSAAHPFGSGLLMEQTGIIAKDQGASVPIVYSNAGSGVSVSANSSLTGLVLFYTGSKAGLGVSAGGTASRVTVRGETPGLSCVVSGTLLDSLCANIQKDGLAAAGFGGLNVNISPVFRGDTIEAPATGEPGLLYSLAASGTANVTVTNSIIHGKLADIEASGQDPTATVSIAADHSDFATTMASSTAGTATITSGAGDISATPKFVSVGARDYVELPGSPTVDAGAKDPATETDLLGHPRAIGGAPDMGAYELLIPPKLSKPTFTAGKKTAAVKLTANPEGIVGRILFKATIIKPPKGSKAKKTLTSKSQVLNPVAANVPISIKLAGLTPKTKYSLVVIAKNNAGTTISKPVKITTK